MPTDALPGLLKAFRLPTVAAIYEEMVAKAEAGNWGYRKFLQDLFESEAEDRRQRRVARLVRDAGLPDGKGLANLDENLLPPKIRRQLPTLLDGGWVERAENLLAFGLPGRGKSHFLAAMAREMVIRHGYTVLYTPTFKLVQQLLVAKRELRLEALLKKLDRYAIVALDDIGYVQQEREEMEVLFTFLAERYERRSVMITSNLPFSKWDQIFKDPMTTMAAVDRVVHHATILEFDGESVRAKEAKARSSHGRGTG
jgi:DNA replication protein DnaC